MTATAAITHTEAMAYYRAVARILDCGDPAQLDRLRDALDLPPVAINSSTTPTTTIKPDAVILALGTTAKNWKHLAKPIKKFLACAGQAGAPGCRTEPDQGNRKKWSGARPKDMFNQEEVNLIMMMAKMHGRGINAIQQKWVWNALGDQV